jgi:hypothetical protein
MHWAEHYLKNAGYMLSLKHITSNYEFLPQFMSFIALQAKLKVVITSVE